MTRHTQRDHPAARVRESQYGRRVSGPEENGRSPHAPAPSVRARRDDTALYAQRLYRDLERPLPTRTHRIVRALTIVTILILAAAFTAAGLCFIAGADPVRATFPLLAAAFLAWCGWTYTTDS